MLRFELLAILFIVFSAPVGYRDDGLGTQAGARELGRDQGWENALERRDDKNR